ncbi:MAG: phosphoribosylaminoimidazolesuccinocarboxamide synthase [Nanoarchaeota archaeon]|nr:phosphoribosylaminoimidazolesuccinocarboxamide synthase [Nanoarchaeota archaeon]
MTLTTQEIKAEVDNTLEKTDFRIGKKYSGKVRDNYILKDKRIFIATDRISCFDRIIGTVPFKGQVLNQLAAYWFDATKDIIKNHIIEVPDPNVTVVHECEPFPIEVVVRGYLTGSLWREYEKGVREIYGLKLLDNMSKNERFSDPIITPTTKAKSGHDMPISKEEIIKQGICSTELWDEVELKALELFSRGTELLAERNLLLVDTKYEFGFIDGELVLMDEIHTPDSSRFWYKDSYFTLFRENKEQKSMDKEYVRQWLLKRGFSGDGEIPKLTDGVKVEAARRYIEIFEQITGMAFKRQEGQILARIENNLKGLT